MGDLKAALEDAMSGHGRLVMLGGEPGIGKTRTAQELAAYGETKGVRVHRGWCFQAEGAPPYWPWILPLRSYIEQREPEQLRSEAGAGAADIAGIIPEIRHKLTDLETPPSLEPEQARFRLFDSITTFFRNASESQPLMLVLDDLHWADRSSLLLLQFMARQLEGCSLLVVGCYRDTDLPRQHPLSATLAELSREPTFRHHLLRGLSQQDTAHFIEITAGVRPPPAVVDHIHAQTEGNPFFTAEVVRLLAEQGELMVAETRGPHPVKVPLAVRNAVGQRLSSRTEECNRMLSIASVVGREFTLGLLSRLMEDVPEERLSKALEEALSGGMIEGSPGQSDRYQFTHALIQETLVSELAVARRLRLHGEIGEALEHLYGPDGSGHAAELAYHYAGATSVIGSQKSVHYSLLAGERALAAYAHEEAVVHFQRALAAKKDSPMDAETAALLFGLGRGQLATLDPHENQEALANLARAFDYYAEIKDVDRAVAIAQSPVQSSLLTGHDTGVMQLVTRALTLVPLNSPEAGRLLCQYGNTLYYQTGDYDGALKALSQALAIARREGDAALEMRTLVAAGHAEASHLHFQESLEYDLQAIELSSRVDDPYEETHARQEVASVLHRTGDLEGARRHAAALLDVAERLRHRTRLWQALQANTVVFFLEGDWQTAQTLSDRALVVSPRNPNLLGFRAIIEYTIGNFDAGETYLERLMEAMQRAAPGPTFEYAYPAIVIPLVAHLTGTDNRVEVVESAAQAVLSSPWATPVLASLASAGLGLLAVMAGDGAEAEEQYRFLRPRQGTMLGGLLDSIMSADRLLGLLAQTAGRFDDAIPHFQDALAFCHKAGYRPELAWTGHDYAGALLQRNGSGDREKAISLLDRALAISHELGMRPLMERVKALKERVTSQAPAVAAYPAALTHREVEVLRLVASGKTSAEIAAELVLSRRTVERHISNIYSKTKSRGRAEATAFAFTHGLVSSS